MYWILVLLFPLSVFAQNGDSQTGDLNTYKDGTNDSNNVTTTTSTVYQGAGAASEIPVSSAISPSLMSGGGDSCLKSISGGLSTLTFGLSKGDYVQDPECNRRKDSLALISAGMKIAGISRLCQDPDTFMAMAISGSPCPLLHKGKTIVGRNAYLMMKKYPDIYIPNYEEKKEYLDKLFGIGENGENGETAEADIDGKSISDRFRKVKW